jgi:hypothetical protein
MPLRSLRLSKSTEILEPVDRRVFHFHLGIFKDVRGGEADSGWLHPIKGPEGHRI